MPKLEPIRLQKFLASCGVASRRACEVLIAEGHVTVNGRVAHIGDKIDHIHDRVCVRGKVVQAVREARVVFMLNKPRGVVSTMSDEKGRRCVADLLRGVNTRVFPVGRLDRDSEGLLLLTDDGALANALTHPKGEVDKLYRVTVRPAPSDVQLEQLRAGVKLDDGAFAKAKAVSILAGEVDEGDRCVLSITLCEGKKRQIRRMCESVGLSVARLKRSAVAGIKLGMLSPGQWRPLTEKERETLYKAAGLFSAM